MATAKKKTTDRTDANGTTGTNGNAAAADAPERPSVDDYKGSVTGFAHALTDYAASEGLGTNDPITYGDIRHVAEQLEAGRYPDSTEPTDESEDKA